MAFAHLNGSDAIVAKNYLQWQGKTYIYLSCLTQNSYWVAEFPVMFHGHVRHRSLRIRERAMGGVLGNVTVEKTNLWPSQVDAILRKGLSCPRTLCGGYAPMIA